MDYSRCMRLSAYGVSSVVSDLDERAWSDLASLKTKPSLLAAPPSFHEADNAKDYMAELAEEIAQSMLEENEGGWRLNETSCRRCESTWASQVFLSTSPQSTLEAMSCWDLVSPSARSNSDMSSGVSSPPTPVEASLVRKDEDDALDLLYAELLRLEMEDEIKVRQQQLMQMKQQQYYQQLLWKMRQREQVSNLSSESHALCKSATSICSSNQMVSSPANAYHRSKLRSDHDSNQSRGKLVQSNVDGLAPVHNVECSKTQWGAAHSIRYAQLQHAGAAAYTNTCNGRQHNKLSKSGSGMQAVFLGTPGARESGGTGVFLPRRVHDPKRKPACSTVLLPSRVIQALNLNVEDTLNPPPTAPLRRELSSHPPSRPLKPAISGEVADRRQEWARRVLVCPALQEVAPDVCLPTEWTY